MTGPKPAEGGTEAKDAVPGMRKTRRVLAYILIALAAIGLLLLGAWSFLRPRVVGGARVADPVAAKAAGDALLASRDTTVLIVVAHPDDTEWWAGGTAAMLARGDRVVLVVGTSGEKGDAGLVPGLGAIREGLQRQGGAIIGYSDIVFLRHPDGGLGQAAAFPGEVAAAFAKYRPSTVITFDTAKEAAGYRHVDHEAAGRVAFAEAEKVGGVTLYLFQTAAPDVIVDYAPVAQQKARAFAVLTRYRDLAPVVGWVNVAVRGLGRTPAPVYGQQARYPEVGVAYGEVFRKVVVAKK